MPNEYQHIGLIDENQAIGSLSRRLTKNSTTATLWTLSGLVFAACGGGGGGGGSSGGVRVSISGLPSEVALYRGTNVIPAYSYEIPQYTLGGTTFQPFTLNIPKLEVTIDSQGQASIANFSVELDNWRGYDIVDGIRINYRIDDYRIDYNNNPSIDGDDFSNELFDLHGMATSLRMTITSPSSNQQIVLNGDPQADGSIDVSTTVDGIQYRSTLNPDPSEPGVISPNLIFPTDPFTVILNANEANAHVRITAADGSPDTTDDQLIADIMGYMQYHSTARIPGTLEFAFQWYLNGNMIPGATSRDYDPTTAGTYHVVVDVRITDAPIPGGPFRPTSIYNIDIPSATVTISAATQASPSGNQQEPGIESAHFVMPAENDPSEDLSTSPPLDMV